MLCISKVKYTCNLVCIAYAFNDECGCCVTHCKVQPGGATKAEPCCSPPSLLSPDPPPQEHTHLTTRSRQKYAHTWHIHIHTEPLKSKYYFLGTLTLSKSVICCFNTRISFHLTVDSKLLVIDHYECYASNFVLESLDRLNKAQ